LIRRDTPDKPNQKGRKRNLIGKKCERGGNYALEGSIRRGGGKKIG